MAIFRELFRDSFYSSVVHLSPRAANAILFILLARQLGPDDAGIYALAATYLFIILSISQGIDDLTVRQVSRFPALAKQYLLTFLIIRLGLSILSYLLSSSIVLLIQYPQNTTIVILLLTLSIIPLGFEAVGVAFLQGKRLFRILASIMFIEAAFKVVTGWFAASQGNITLVAIFWLAGSALGMFLILFVSFWTLRGVQLTSSLDLSLIRKILTDSKTFLSLTILSTIEAQADIIILSILRSESDVGWYNAATTIVFTLTIISQAVRTSIYPVMAHYAQSGDDRLKSLYHQSSRYLAMIALPMVTGILILADQIVMLIYGINFEPTISAVRILIPVVIFMFLNVANVRLMLVNERQNNLVKFMLLSVGLNIILNILLDSIYGANSAAFARLVSTAFLFFAIYRYTVKNLIHSQIRNYLLPPIIASILMGGIVWILRDFHLWFSITFGFAIYIVLLWVVGGITKNDFERVKNIFA